MKNELSRIGIKTVLARQKLDILRDERKRINYRVNSVREKSSNTTN